MERDITPATREGIAQGRLAEKKGSRWQIGFIVAIGLAITACKYIFAYQNVAYGIVMALALAIVIYILLSSLHLERRIVICAESLTLIPLYILFTSSLP